jgi:hypothetical protein
MIKVHVKLGIALFFAAMSLQTYGQKADINRLLSAALQHKGVKILIRSGEDLLRLNHNLPFIEKMEFRTETDRLLTSRQEFLARTSFNGFRQKKAENDKFIQLVKWKSGKMNEVRNEMFSDRYFDIIDVLYQEEKRIISLDLLSHFAKKEKIYEELMINGLSADLSDYIKIKVSILEDKAKIQDAEIEIENRKKKLGLDSSTVFDTSDVIGIDQVASMISTLAPDFEKHSFLMDFDAEGEYLQSELLAEKAEVGKIIDFVQVKYTVRDDLLLQNRFSVGVGFLIPWRGSSGLKQSETRLKQNILLAEKGVKKLELQSDFERLKNSFQQKYTQYNMLQDVINDAGVKKLKDQVIASGRLDPLEVIEFEKPDIELRLKLCNIKHELLELYIQILSSAGDLFSLPYKNYLHPLFPEIAD